MREKNETPNDTEKNKKRWNHEFHEFARMEKKGKKKREMRKEERQEKLAVGKKTHILPRIIGESPLIDIPVVFVPFVALRFLMGGARDLCLSVANFLGEFSVFRCLITRRNFNQCRS